MTSTSVLCIQCHMHFSMFIWLSHLLLSSVQFMPSLQKCLRLVKQCQGTINHFPRRTSFKKWNLISLILKDYVQEDPGEPVLITGSQLRADSLTGQDWLLPTKALCSALHILDSPC